jgi:metal transporter CNNM
MSFDEVELEVLIRSGSPLEARHANSIMLLIRNQHFLLVTLLLCNAASMEALPLFLDRLADPVTAIIVSVTAVLLFGEIIPQALCTRWAWGG